MLSTFRIDISFVVLGSLFCTRIFGQERLDCRPDALNTCIKLADPLLEDPRYVFPSTTKDIDHVCNVLFPRTWSEFVGCIKQYTSDCLTSDQRAEFNRAVGDSINSVHKMCTNEDYKNDYLEHAGCIKEKSTSSDHCGDHYHRLVEQVKGSRPASQREFCCSHGSFKECVLHKTTACACISGNCDSRQGMSAQGFARAMLDKALGFLLKQCQDYVPNERDCPAYRRPIEEQPRYNNYDDIGDDDRVGVTTESRYGDGVYFPSGAPGREERRENDNWEAGSDGWTGLGGEKDKGNDWRQEEEKRREDDKEKDWRIEDDKEKDWRREENKDNDWRGEVEDTRPITPRDPFEREPEQYDQITEANNFLFNDPIDVMESRQEEERTRQPPWLPELDSDIQSFDDLFSNAVETSIAAQVGSGVVNVQSLSVILLFMLLAIVIHNSSDNV